MANWISTKVKPPIGIEVWTKTNLLYNKGIRIEKLFWESRSWYRKIDNSKYSSEIVYGEIPDYWLILNVSEIPPICINSTLNKNDKIIWKK